MTAFTGPNVELPSSATHGTDPALVEGPTPEVAAASFDNNRTERVLDKWWRVAALRSITLSETEQDQLRRADAGDLRLLGMDAMPGVGFLRSLAYLRLVWVGVGGKPASKQFGEPFGMFQAG